MKPIHIALISAMPQEIGKTIAQLKNVRSIKHGDLDVYAGEWKDESCNSLLIYISVAWSGWGKVSAARAVTRLITSSLIDIPIDIILFTGVAGAANSNVKQWDIIVPEQVIQHDMDARPIYKKYVIPALNKDKLNADKCWSNRIYKSLQKSKQKGLLNKFGNIHRGIVATGDTFVSNKEKLEKISTSIEGLKAVEMEGAAVAQVAIQEGIPWTIIRVISDEANQTAGETFSEFLTQYENCAWILLKSILNGYAKAH